MMRAGEVYSPQEHLSTEHIRQVKLLVNGDGLALLRTHQEKLQTTATLQSHTFIEILPLPERRLMYSVLLYTNNARFYLAQHHLGTLVRDLDFLEQRRQSTSDKLEIYLGQDYGWPRLLVLRALNELDDCLSQDLGQTIRATIGEQTAWLDLANYNFWDFSDDSLWQKLTNINGRQLEEISKNFTGPPSGHLGSKPLVLKDIEHWRKIMQQIFDDSIALTR